MVHKPINFEIAALFNSSNRQVKKRGKFKANLSFNQMESFLNCLSSSRNLKQRFRDFSFSLNHTYYHIVSNHFETLRGLSAFQYFISPTFVRKVPLDGGWRENLFYDTYELDSVCRGVSLSTHARKLTFVDLNRT